MIDPWISAAADMAAVWFEETMPDVPAITADPIPAVRLIKSAEWALGGDGVEGLKRLEDTTQRAVFDGARDTTLANVEKTGIKWARDARPDACAFCRMLAVRTGKWLYSSKKAAADRTSEATKVHNLCHCVPIEVATPADYQLPGHVQKWDDEYDKAKANAGTTNTKQLLAAWREQSADIN